MLEELVAAEVRKTAAAQKASEVPPEAPAVAADRRADLSQLSAASYAMLHPATGLSLASKGRGLDCWMVDHLLCRS